MDIDEKKSNTLGVTEVAGSALNSIHYRDGQLLEIGRLPSHRVRMTMKAEDNG